MTMIKSVTPENTVQSQTYDIIMFQNFTPGVLAWILVTFLLQPVGIFSVTPLLHNATLIRLATRTPFTSLHLHIVRLAMVSPWLQVIDPLLRTRVRVRALSLLVFQNQKTVQRRRLKTFDERL